MSYADHHHCRVKRRNNFVSARQGYNPASLFGDPSAFQDVVRATQINWRSRLRAPLALLLSRTERVGPTGRCSLEIKKGSPKAANSLARQNPLRRVFLLSVVSGCSLKW